MSRNIRFRGVAFSVAVLLSLPSFGRAADTYIGPNNGIWSDPENWSGGVPNSSDFDVLISPPSPVTVQLDVDTSIKTLTLNSPHVLSLLADLSLAGNSLVNTGTVLFNATASAPALTFNADATLSGGGTILMTSTASVLTGASGVHLTTNNLITGSGNLGSGLLKITNTGTISATVGVLSLAPQNATDGFTNAGTLLANGGTLVLQAATYTNMGGTIRASANSVVSCENAIIAGGTVRAAYGGTVTLGGTILNGVSMAGLMQVQGGVTLVGAGANAGTLTGGPVYLGAPVLGGTLALNNTGLVQVNGGGISANTTLTGGGSFVLNGSGLNSNFPCLRLTTDNFICGSGNLGSSDAGILLTNNGTISANVPGGQLIVNGPNIGSSGTLSSYNTGVLSAEGGRLFLNNFAVLGSTNLINTGGIIEARANSIVNLSNDYIVGGTMRSVSGGTVALAGVTLSGVSMSGLLQVLQGPVTLVGSGTNAGTLSGGPVYFGVFGNSTPVALANTGLVQLAGSGIYANTTLTGGGSLALTSGGLNSNNSFARLTTNNFICGTGYLGTNDFGIPLSNSGTISANIQGAQLTIYGPGNMTSGTLSSYNTGVLCAEGGTLNLNNFATLGGTNLINTGGIIEARANSLVNLNNDCIVGGTVRSVSGGTVTLSSATLSGVAMSGFLTSSLGTVTLMGAITNSGTLKAPVSLGVNGSSMPVALANTGVVLAGAGTIYANTTLTGGGSLALTAIGLNSINSLPRITSDNFICGSGFLGSSGLGIPLSNSGTISANIQGMQLTINGPGNLTSGTVSSYNTGIICAERGILNLTGFMTAGGSNLINTGGIIEARAASTVTLNSDYIVGGTVRSVSGGTVTLLGTTFSGVSMSGLLQVVQGFTLVGSGTNAGTLSGGRVNFGVNGDSTPVALANSGLVRLNGGSLYANTTLTGGGSLALNGGFNPTFSMLRLTTNNFICGNGDIGVKGGGIILTNSGTISANVQGSMLNLSGPNIGSSATLSSYNTGVLCADRGSLNLYDFATLGGTNLINTGGIIEARFASIVALQNDYIVSGTVRSVSGGTVALAGTTLNDVSFSGLLQAQINTSYLVDCLTNPGVISAAGGILVLSGAPMTNTGTIEARNGGRVSLLTKVNGGLINLAFGGILALDAPDVIGSDSTIVFSGGILQFSASNTTDYSPLFTQANGQQYGISTNGQTVAFNTPLTSPGSTFTKTGDGTLVLNAANSFDQGIFLNQGVLRLHHAGALGTTGTMTFAGGILQFTSANASDYSARFSQADGQQYAIDTNGQNITFASPLASLGAALTKLGAGTLALAAPANFSGSTFIAAGTLLFSGTSPHSIAAVSGAGTLQVDSSAALTCDGLDLAGGVLNVAGAMTIRSSASGGAYATYAAGHASDALSGTSKVAALGLTITGTLDIKNNALILEATDAASLQAAIVNAATTMLGSKITSSTAAGSTKYTLAIIDNSRLGAASFGGLAVDSASVIVTEALKGDANLDGVVNTGDLLIWKSNFNATSAYTVSRGDFNGDGLVDTSDLLVWKANFGANIAVDPAPSDGDTGSLGTLSLPAFTDGGTSAVPEPASLAVLALGAVGLLGRRKRR